MMRVGLIMVLFGIVVSARCQTKIRLSDLQRGATANQVPITDASGVLSYKLTDNKLRLSDGVLTSVVNGVSATTAIEVVVTNSLIIATANYQLQPSDETVFVNASTSVVDVLLPQVASLGKKYTIKKVDESDHQVVVLGNGKLINGLVKIANNLPYVGWVVQYDGVGWIVVNYIF